MCIRDSLDTMHIAKLGNRHLGTHRHLGASGQLAFGNRGLKCGLQEAALQAAVAEGKLAAGAEVAVSAEVTIAELGYVHRVEGNLLTPGNNG